MNLIEHKTLTGIPLDESLFNQLARLYHPDSYTEVGGAGYLTDMNNGQVTRRLFETFGPRGVGWDLDVAPDHVLVSTEGNQTRAVVKVAWFWYAFRKDTPSAKVEYGRISTAGAAKNSDAGYAITGAMTSCIKKAISYLGHQNALYCGRFDHSTVRHLVSEHGYEYGFLGGSEGEDEDGQ